MARSARLGEYFVVVGAGDDLVPIAGQNSSDPLKISFQGAFALSCHCMTTLIRSAGDVLDRFPMTVSPNDSVVEFPPGIAMFCLPHGLRFSLTSEMPTFFSFASTIGSGERLYGYCLMFFERASNVYAAFA